MSEQHDLEDNVVVEMGEWRHAEAPQSIETGGVGPCIVIAFFDDEGAQAWLMHAPGLNHGGGDDLRQMLREAAAEATSPKIWVGGGDDSEPDCREDVHAARASVLKDVADAFPAI